MKTRNIYYDIMRVVACLMIVGMHAPMPSDNANSIFLNITSYCFAPGLCLFFVLSGALLLPVKTDTRTFLKKRLGKVVFPTLCFTFLYLGLKYITGQSVDFLSSVLSIPFSAQGYGILWFMYTLVGLYLLAPIISRWLESASKRELEFYLGLWVISLCYPILRLFVQVNESATGILYYFTGYAGYFVLGYYLNKYPNAVSFKRLVIPVTISVIAPVACKLMSIQVASFDLFGYLSIFIMVLTVSLFWILNKVPVGGGGNNKTAKFITLTSNLCFGIYLSHIAIMRYGIWKLDFIANISNYYLQWAVIVILTFSLSWILAFCISKLSFGDYIIGYKQAK